MEVIKNSLLRGHTSEFLDLRYYQCRGQEEGWVCWYLILCLCHKFKDVWNFSQIFYLFCFHLVNEWIRHNYKRIHNPNTELYLDVCFSKKRKKDTGNSHFESFFLCGLNNTKQIVSFHFCVGLSFKAQSEWIRSSCSLVLQTWIWQLKFSKSRAPTKLAKGSLCLVLLLGLAVHKRVSCLCPMYNEMQSQSLDLR